MEQPDLCYGSLLNDEIPVPPIIRAIAVILAARVAVFININATGDPVRLLMPGDATEAEIEQMRDALGYDRSMLVRVRVCDECSLR